MILSNSQIATLQRALANSNHVLPKVEWLAAMAEINTALQQRVRELRAQREYQVSLATTGLEVDRQLSAKYANGKPA